MAKLLLILNFMISMKCLQSLADEFHFDPDSVDSKAHLQEDLDGVINKKTEDMTASELQFHYFRQHDYDRNEKLDGNELIMSITHHQHGSPVPKERAFSDHQLISIIDEILKRHDLDKDGMMTFEEYVGPLQTNKEE